MTLNKQDSASARSAISRGDLTALERYLREGGSAKDTVAATSATQSLGAAEEGRLIVLNRAAGVTCTLPAATGSQSKYTFVVQTTFSGGNGVIKVANSSDSMIGNITMVTTTLAAGSEQAPPAGSDTITLNGGTQGGAQGTVITLTDVAPTLWLVTGDAVCIGAAATPYSNTV